MKNKISLIKSMTATTCCNLEGGTLVRASAAPDCLGKAELVNPEEAFAASLASCHMLTFLAIASMKKYTVATYEDYAVAILGKKRKIKKGSNNRVSKTEYHL
jgi:organic hydroperoxide reductase OsmC/OhrA